MCSDDDRNDLVFYSYTNHCLPTSTKKASSKPRHAGCYQLTLRHSCMHSKGVYVCVLLSLSLCIPG